MADTTVQMSISLTIASGAVGGDGTPITPDNVGAYLVGASYYITQYQGVEITQATVTAVNPS
jgi:hypothetical protein